MDLTQYRKQIDSVDDEILRLFIERMEIAQEIARYKKARGMPALDAAREREKLARLGERAGADMRGYTDRLFSLLMELSRAHQEKILNAEKRSE